MKSLNLPEEMAYDLEGRIQSMRVFSTFILPTSFAGFLALAFPACVGLFMDRFQSRDKAERRFTVILGALVLLPILLAFYFTKSKGGALALAVGAASFTLWAFGRFLWTRRAQILGGLVALVIVVTVAQLSDLLPPLRDYPGSFKVRTAYWRAGLAVIEESPFVGIGLDNFADAYAAKKRAADQETRRAHNDYIQITAETGLVGFLIYLAAWVAFWRRLRRREAEPVLPPPETQISRGLLFAAVLALGVGVFLLEGGSTLHSSHHWYGLAWPVMLCMAWVGFVTLFLVTGNTPGPLRNSYATIGMACGLIAFLTHSFLDFDHYVGGIHQTVWLFMGLILAARLSEEQTRIALDKTLGFAAQAVLICASAAVALFCVYGFVLPAANAAMYREQAREVDPDPTAPQQKRTMKERRDLMEKAIAAYWWDARNHAFLSDLFLAQRYAHPLAPGALTAESQAIIHIRDAIALNPFRSEYYARLGRLYEQRWLRNGRRNPGEYQQTLEACIKAEDLFPSNPDAALSLGRLYDLAGKPDIALGKYLRAMNMSEEQYQTTRKLREDEYGELWRRIQHLKDCVTRHKTPDPLRFRAPRLRGLPGPMRPPPRPKAPA